MIEIYNTIIKFFKNILLNFLIFFYDYQSYFILSSDNISFYKILTLNIYKVNRFSCKNKKKMAKKINRTYTNNSSPIINLNISGNADRETVNALKRESENIIKKAVEMTFKTANKYASII